jgi:hypothetical protein
LLPQNFSFSRGKRGERFVEKSELDLATINPKNFRMEALIRGQQPLFNLLQLRNEGNNVHKQMLSLKFTLSKV